MLFTFSCLGQLGVGLDYAHTNVIEYCAEMNTQYYFDTDYVHNLTATQINLLIILVPELVHLECLVCLCSTLQLFLQLSAHRLPIESQFPGAYSNISRKVYDSEASIPGYVWGC